MNARDVLQRYAERHNDAVRSGDFAPLLALFADDASLLFRGLPLDPRIGAEAVARAFDEHPPDDELVLLEVREEPVPDVVTADYAWAREREHAAGELRLRAKDGKIAALTISAR